MIFDKVISKKEYSRIKSLFIKVVFVVGVGVLVFFASKGLVLFFDSRVITYPYQLNLIVPVSYLINEFLKLIDNDVKSKL